MNTPQAVAAVPKIIGRRFSTGSIQSIKQTEEFQANTSAWDRWAKGMLICVGFSGFSFSAFSTRNLYDSRQKCKAFWNRP